MRLYLLILLKILFCSSTDIQSKLTIDEFFNGTSYLFLNLSPDGQYLLVGTQRAAWDLNRFEDSLWLYHTFTRRKQLITKNLYRSIKPQWSPSGNSFFYSIDNNQSKSEQYVYNYNVISKEELSVEIGNETLLSVTWGENDLSIYIAVISSASTEHSNGNDEWKDVIRYRQDKQNNLVVLYRIEFLKKIQKMRIKKNFIRNLNFLISELLFVPLQSRLIVVSTNIILEEMSDYEIYSLDLHNSSILTRLTNNQRFENNLKLSNDGKFLFFQSDELDSNNKKLVLSQARLYSINLINGHIERWTNDFDGFIQDYTMRSEGGVYLLGQLGTNIHIYSQQSPSKQLILQSNINGTFRSISSSAKRFSSIAYLYSSSEQAEEVYFINHIKQLQQPKRITNENQFFTNKNLPHTKVYQWINNDDNRTIEGILHYPPGKFEEKNLPLLVLIHGGPTSASLNSFFPDWYTWAPLAASEGWLVLEPNYRGSTGYGDKFLNEVRFQLLSRPGKDILFGVDQLVHDGIADPTQLNIGGYSYGGLLTNWLITQTTRFNAALSGAGVIEHSSMFGTTDFPVYIKLLIGGFSWEIQDLYVSESAVYQLDKVQTPTLITTGTSDVRVPPEQSFMLERSLHYLGVPVQLLLFPNEGHGINKNPWHGKIKVREELKWLEMYGHRYSK